MCLGRYATTRTVPLRRQSVAAASPASRRPDVHERRPPRRRHVTGVISFVDTFDLQTFDVVSRQIVVEDGPHPEADSDFTVFCGAMTGALS